MGSLTSWDQDKTVVDKRMNKFVTVVCSTGLARLGSGAPLTTISLGGQSENDIVDRILAQLDGPIDAAIQAALSSSSSSAVTAQGRSPLVTSFTGTVSQGPAVTVETSGTLTGNNVNGQFSSSSSSVGEWSDWTTVSGGNIQSVPRPVAVAPVSSVETSSNSLSSSKSTESSVVTNVVSQLTPQISAAVQAALEGLTATTAVQAPVEVTAVVPVVQAIPAAPAVVPVVPATQTVSVSVSQSSTRQNEAQITSQIITVLTPQIAEA